MLRERTGKVKDLPKPSTDNPASCIPGSSQGAESMANGHWRTTSAGYRLPNTSHAGDSSSSPSLSSPQVGRSTPTLAKRTSNTRGEQQETLQDDQVRRDKIWREFVGAERRATKDWYQNWSFLKDYDTMGKKKEHKQLPEYESVFSDRIPNTNSRIIGSRMNTDLGKTLVKMDYFFNYGRRKNKLGQELLPS